VLSDMCLVSTILFHLTVSILKAQWSLFWSCVSPAAATGTWEQHSPGLLLHIQVQEGDMSLQSTWRDGHVSDAHLEVRPEVQDGSEAGSLGVAETVEHRCPG
jgi:hypothetical protein